MLRSAFLSLTTLLVLGCAEGILPEVTDETDSATQGLTQPTGLATVPVYIGAANQLPVTDGAYLVHGLFELNAKAKIGLHLERAAYSAPGTVGFKLYRVRDNGKLTFLKSIDGADGTADATLQSTKGGTYVIEMASDPHPADLNLTLTCRSTKVKCAPSQQPGEICGGLIALQPCAAAE